MTVNFEHFYFFLGFQLVHLSHYLTLGKSLRQRWKCINKVNITGHLGSFNGVMIKRLQLDMKALSAETAR